MFITDFYLLYLMKEVLKLCGVTVVDNKKDIVFELVYGPGVNGRFERVPYDLISDGKTEIPKELVFTV